MTQWEEWKQHPVTVKLWAYLEAQRSKVLEAWANGAYTGRDSNDTLQVNAKAIGAVQCIDSLLKMEASDLDNQE